MLACLSLTHTENFAENAKKIHPRFWDLERGCKPALFDLSNWTLTAWCHVHPFWNNFWTRTLSCKTSKGCP